MFLKVITSKFAYSFLQRCQRWLTLKNGPAIVITKINLSYKKYTFIFLFTFLYNCKINISYFGIGLNKRVNHQSSLPTWKFLLNASI